MHGYLFFPGEMAYNNNAILKLFFSIQIPNMNIFTCNSFPFSSKKITSFQTFEQKRDKYLSLLCLFTFFFSTLTVSFHSL